MTNVTTIKQDIEFARQGMDEFGHCIAPMLRYVAGLTLCSDATKAEFIEAATSFGYNASTASTCWHAGRKFMMDLDKELVAA